MDEMNKLSEEENNEELQEQENPTPECEDVSEPVSEPVAEVSEPIAEIPAPKPLIHNLPFIIGGAVAGVAAIAVSVALILGGGSHNHSFGEWQIVDEPTCLNAGMEERVCECDERETRPIAALGHTEVVDSAVNPTCTSTGLTEGKHCSECNTVIIAQETIPMLSHTYDNKYDADCNVCGYEREAKCAHNETITVEGKEATCTTTGLTDGEKCKKCDEIIVVQTTIPMVAHTETNIPAEGATCVTTGLTSGTKCSVCDKILVSQQETPKIAHTYDNKYDEECNICGYKRDAECAHTETEVIPGKVATCTVAGLTDGEKCKKCGETLVSQTAIPVKAHTEVIDVSVEATCTSKGLTEGKHCSVCSKVIIAQNVTNMKPHTEVVDSAVSATCTSAGLTEGKHCSVCSRTLVSQAVIPMKAHMEVIDADVASTCTSTGLTEGKHCSVCFKVLIAQLVTPKVAHTYDDQYDETCNKCGFERDAACAHAETETINGYDSTCIATGLTDGMQCKKCGEILSEQIAISMKPHTDVIDVAVAPTCTSAGLTEGKHCSVCSKILVAQTTVSKLGHTEVIDPAVSATCTTNGKTEGKHCSRCNEILVAQTTVSKLGHTEVIDPAVSATCTSAGLTEGKHCSVCSTVLLPQTTIPMKPHTEATNPALEPTCTSVGATEGKYCSVCSKVLVAQTEIPMKPHTEVVDIGVEATCTNGGLTDGKHCSVCGTTTVAHERVPALGHIEVIDAAVPATCTTNGKTEGKHCSRCYETLVDQTTVSALGHNEIIDPAISATCTTNGKTEGKHCSRCNETLIAQNNIPASHTDGKWITDIEATCTVGGSKHQICSVCNVTIKTESIEAKGHSYSITVVNRDCGNNARIMGTCSTCGHSYDEEITPIALTFVNTSNSSATVNGYGSYSKGYSVTVIGGYGTILLKYELYTSATATNPTSTIDFTTDTATSVSFRGYANAIDNYVYKITAKDEVGNISVYRFSLKDESLIDYKQKGDIEHSFSEWSVTRESTCSEYGEKQSVCSVCNNIVTDIVEKKPHTVVVDEAVPANCLQTGLTEGSHCSVCETVIVAQTETPAGEHSYENKICICGRDVTEDAIATYDLSKNQDGSIIGYLTNTNGGQKLYILGNGAIKNYGTSQYSGSPFYNNKNITEAYVGEGITSIGDSMFWFCSKLKTVNIPQSVTYIGSYSFTHCSLTKITLPNKLTNIGSAAFNGNYSLKDIVFPESLEYIGYDAFNGCDMTSIYIPKNVSYIGKEAFSFNTNLYQIAVDENNFVYHSNNNCIIETSTKTLVVGCKNSIIPSDGSVIYIGAYAFSGSKLTNLTIPSSIVKIGAFAFSACSMTEVVIPISVNEIGSNAFYLCKSLTIYCEASSKPSGWNNEWDNTSYSATVVWGYSED